MADEGEWVDEEPTAQPQNEGQWVNEPQQAQAQPQDEGQWVDEKQGEQPEPEGALGSAVRAGAHAVIPTIAGAAGFGAGALLGNLPGGLLGGIGAASLAGMAQEKLLKTFGFDDEAQQAANRQAHPWATGFGEVAAAAPTFGVGAEAMLAQRALTAGIGGATDLIMGGDPQHAAAVAAGSALLGKPTKLGESLIGAGETAGQKISSLIKTPASQGPGSQAGAGQAEEKVSPLTENAPSDELHNQVTRSEQQYGKAATTEVSPPIQGAGAVPKDIQVALKTATAEPTDTTPTPSEAPSKPADTTPTPAPPEPPEIAMLKQQAAQREAAANRTNNDVLKGPVLDEYAPGSPYEMARAGDLTADKAVEISNKLKENQAAIEDKIFGDKGIADKWRKLQRQSDIAWKRARDKQAREFDEQIFELEKRANLTPKDEAFLNGEGPEYSDPQAWRDHAQDLRNLEGSRKDRVTALGYDLRRLPEEGKVRPEDHWTLAKVQYAMSEEAKAGGNPEALLRDAFNKSAERYGGGADAKEIVQDDMARLKHLMENPEPAPRALPSPPRNEEGGTPSPELNEATRQAVEAAGGGKPPPPPEEGGGKPPPPPKEGGGKPPPPPEEGGGKPPPPPEEGGGKPPPPPEEPPKGGPAEPIPPERYTGGKFDTPLNAANTVNNALDNVVRNQAALWHGFRNLLKDITNKDSSLMGKGGGDISRAIERGEFDKLDPKVQEAYNKHIGPINEESAKVAAELDKRGIRPPDEDMAPNYIMHNRKMPFSLKEALNNDPTGMLQGMRKPDTFKGLEYRGAVADDGSRLSIRDLGDKYSVGKNGEESFYNKPNSKDGAKMFKNGDEIDYNGKKYKIDRGIQDEITRDFRDEKGRPIEYHQNAILSALERNSQLKAALQYDDMMRTFKTDKALDPYRTTMNDPKAAQLAKAGWEKVDSPGFENILMHPDMAQAIKNNFEPGLFKANPITNFARAMNQFAVRSIFWNPVPHSLNAAVHYIVARGEDWLPVKFEPGTYKVGTVTLDNYRSLMGSLSKAWDTVVNQTPDLVKLNNSGLPMVWSSIERQRAHELTGKLLDTSLKSEPKFWAGMASKYGLGAPVDAVRAVYNSSAKVLWMASDVMTAARYHELMGKGLSSDEAISHMSIHMPDYRPALSLLGVRGLPSAMGDSTLFMFGRYHAGMLRSLENMVTGVLGKNSTVDERRQAFGNIGALFVMGAVMMPMLDKLAQSMTGNKDAEVRRSGPLTPIKNVTDAVKGESTFGRALGNVLTLSPLANHMVETIKNRDFAGHNIIEPASPFYKKAGQYADYLARGMVAPYGTAVKMSNPKGPGAVSTLTRELTGVKAPTAEEQQGKSRGLDRSQRDAAYRDQHPRGFIESTLNKYTPQSPKIRQKDAQP